MITCLQLMPIFIFCYSNTRNPLSCKISMRVPCFYIHKHLISIHKFVKDFKLHFLDDLLQGRGRNGERQKSPSSGRCRRVHRVSYVTYISTIWCNILYHVKGIICNSVCFYTWITQIIYVNLFALLFYIVLR